MNTEDTIGAEESDADDWLNAKLRALNLKGKRYMPEAEQRRNAEKMLLEVRLEEFFCLNLGRKVFLDRNFVF